MKKFYTYAAMMAVALITMTVTTACDSDVALAYDLEGVWQGTITGNYYADRYRVTTTEYDTEIMFRQSGFESRGTGYEIDREYGSRRFTKTYFDWSVRNGRIYLDYDDGYRVVIRDFETYSMNGLMRFRGYFDNYDTGEEMASFSLVKVVDSSKYFDYGYTNSPYYAPRSEAPSADSLAVNP